jgi:hypothetical protein
MPDGAREARCEHLFTPPPPLGGVGGNSSPSRLSNTALSSDGNRAWKHDTYLADRTDVDRSPRTGTSEDTDPST